MIVITLVVSGLALMVSTVALLVSIHIHDLHQQVLDGRKRQVQVGGDGVTQVQAGGDLHDPYARLRPHKPEQMPAPGYDRVRHPGEQR